VARAICGGAWRLCAERARGPDGSNSSGQVRGDTAGRRGRPSGRGHDAPFNPARGLIACRCLRHHSLIFLILRPSPRGSPW